MNDDTIKQYKGNELEQVKFLRSLAVEFDSQNQQFHAARWVFNDYRDIPKEMNKGEWTRVTQALRDFYQSTQLIYKIAQLIEIQVINSEIFYISYNNHEIISWIPLKLRFLTRWCGTGLDLAANYDSYELVRMFKIFRRFLTELDSIHEKHFSGLYVKENGHTVDFESSEQEAINILADPSRYDVASDNYIDNYVIMK
jgi:hypothetical protein